VKKIGIISLALVLALGALGVAYAPWTDEVEITQVVHTGSLEVGVFGHAWLEGDEKDVAELKVTHGDFKFSKYEGELDFFESVTVSVGNLYPSVWVNENFYIGVGGTVPVHLYPEIEFFGDWDLLYACMEIEWSIFLPDGTMRSGFGIPDFVEILTGMQVHPCETIVIWLDKHLEQCGGRNQGLKGGFTLTVTGYQYNYDPYPDAE